MDSTKLVMLISFLALCCILGVQSDASYCYACSGETECKDNLKKVLCSPAEANRTIQYLNYNYKNVDFDESSFAYECLSDYLKSTVGTQQYKGCVYAIIRACGLATNDGHDRIERNCKECNTDYCNPAARAHINAWHIIGAVALVAVTKFTMQ